MLRVKGYVRYMDDMILWYDDLHEQSIQRRCVDFASDTLGLEFKPADVRRTSTGVDFLGCRIWPTHVELNRRSKRRWYCRVRVLERAERLALNSAREWWKPEFLVGTDHFPVRTGACLLGEIKA